MPRLEHRSSIDVNGEESLAGYVYDELESRTHLQNYGTLQSVMSSEPKSSTTPESKNPVYLWMPVSPEYMVNKPESGHALHVTMLKENAQVILDGLREINPHRDDLPESPCMLSYDSVMEFAKHAGYSTVYVMEHKMHIPV